jgi:membrane protease YdiL (CAAX protease family)
MARLAPHLRGHLFLFDAKPTPAFDPSSGARLLWIFLFLEGFLGPRLWILRPLGMPGPPFWVRVPLLLGLALLLVRYFARLEPSQLGLRPWRRWTTTEKSYFLQVLLLANVVFLLLFAGRIRAIVDRPSWPSAAIALPVYLVWGFYQELMYRGILQRVLVTRWGPLPGILVSNLVYTFGPLHFYHFTGKTIPQALPMFAGIFAIGLFFAVLMWRSGNLWMVGIFHGLGDGYITGLAEIGFRGR